MLKKMCEDLRFFIGAFFLIVGSILTVEGLRNQIQVEGYNLNLIVGVVFVMFSIMALWMSYKASVSWDS